MASEKLHCVDFAHNPLKITAVMAKNRRIHGDRDSVTVLQHQWQYAIIISTKDKMTTTGTFLQAVILTEHDIAWHLCKCRTFTRHRLAPVPYLYIFRRAGVAAFRALPAVRQVMVDDAVAWQLRICLVQAERMHDVPAEIALHQLPLRVVSPHCRRLCCRISITARRVAQHTDGGRR